MITLYGIKNCDTVKKAQQWLDNKAISYRFHDFRSDGLAPAQVKYFLLHCDGDALLNRRSTTWKTLNDTQKTDLNNAQTLIDLLIAHPTLIKRPVLDTGDKVLVGFNPDAYQTVLRSRTE